MYALYWSAQTGAFAVQAALEEAGAAYEKRPVDLEAGAQRTPGFLALNPLAQVPALVLPDGTVLTESAAILLYLAERHPQADLMPPPGRPGRAAFYRWLVFMAVNVYGADLRVYYPQRYTTDPAGTAAVSAAGVAEMDRCLAILSDALGAGPWLLGAAYSALDPYLVMLCEWHPDSARLFSAHPGLERLRARLLERPAIARIWAEHFPAPA